MAEEQQTASTFTKRDYRSKSGKLTRRKVQEQITEAQMEDLKVAQSLESLGSLKKEKQLILENSVGSVLNASRRQLILININAKLDY